MLQQLSRLKQQNVGCSTSIETKHADWPWEGLEVIRPVPQVRLHLGTYTPPAAPVPTAAVSPLLRRLATTIRCPSPEVRLSLLRFQYTVPAALHLHSANCTDSPMWLPSWVEPIQREVGIVVPDDGYLFKVDALCKKYNVLLICDEVSPEPASFSVVSIQTSCFSERCVYPVGLGTSFYHIFCGSSSSPGLISSFRCSCG